MSIAAKVTLSDRSGQHCPVLHPSCGGRHHDSGLANTKRICQRAATAVRSCCITIQDTEGVTHTVEVTAASLYEAVAQGLASFRGNEWMH